MKRGFTLLELMVVIAVVAILAALLVINLQGISADAKNSVAKSDLRNIKTALIMYEAHFNLLPPQEDWEECLQNDDPRIIDRIPPDPWSPSGDKYRYKLNSDSPAGKTYVVLSVGANGVEEVKVYYDRVTDKGDDIIVTNARSLE